MAENSIKTEKAENRRGDKRGLHPNSLKNLHHPGIGRPRNELSITNKQREMLSQVCPYDSKGRTWLEWLAERGLALAGENATYYRDLMDRLEGKVPQPISGDKENPLQVEHDVKGKLLSILNSIAARTGKAAGNSEAESE